MNICKWSFHNFMHSFTSHLCWLSNKQTMLIQNNNYISDIFLLYKIFLSLAIFKNGNDKAIANALELVTTICMKHGFFQVTLLETIPAWGFRYKQQQPIANNMNLKMHLHGWQWPHTTLTRYIGGMFDDRWVDEWSNH